MNATARLAERVRALPKSARARRLLAWLGGFLVLVAILGFLVAPPLVRSQAEKLLSEKLHRPVTVANVRVNPFAPSITVQGLAVKERDGTAVAAGFDELYVRLSYTSLFRLAPVVSAVRLEKPVLRVVRRADRAYNFQDLIDEALAPSPASVAPAEPLRFSVNNIQVLDGRIGFDDAVAGEKHEIADLKVGLPFVSSLPSHVDIEVQPELSAKVNGAPLAIKGDTHPFKDTNETTVDIDLDALSLPRVAEYSPVPLRFRLASGQLDTRLRVRFVTRAAKPVGLSVSGQAGVSKLALLDMSGTPLVGFERFAVDLEGVDLFGREAKVKSVRLEKPAATVVRSRDGRLNLLEAIPALPPEPSVPKGAKPPADAKPFRFSVDEIVVSGGRLSLADLSVTPRAFRTELDSVEVAVKQLANHGDRKAAITASFATDGLGAFRHEGRLRLAPVVAEGRVSGEGFRLARLYPYLEPLLNLDIADGAADFSAGYSLSLAGDSPDLKVSGAGATVRSVVLRYPGEKDAFVRLPLAQLSDASADLAARTIAIGEVIAKGGQLAAHREAGGNLKFARLLKQQSSPATPEQGAARGKDAGSPWRIDIRRGVIDGFGATFTDDIANPPVVVKVTRIQASADNWSNAPGTRSAIRASATVNGTGSVSARGPVTMSPLAADLDVEAKRLEFAFAQPYLDARLNLAVVSGALSAKGRLKASVPPDGPPGIAFKGDVSVNDFASVDRLSREDFARWGSLRVGGIDFALAPLMAHVGEVALSDFYARLILSAAGRLNLEDVMRGEGAEARSLTDTELRRVRPTSDPERNAPAAAPVPASGPPADIRLGRVVLSGGHVAFSDFFVKPNYAANLKAIGGSVSEMSAAKPGVVDLAAKLDGTAPVEVAGRLNALSPDLLVDLSATAKDIELPAFSPYAIKYAGYGIERGKLSVRLKYLVENRRLAAENNVYLDQLTFGPKVESPTATKLPVLLAVSLLKDRNGVIDIDLPISGSVDDPQFSVWGIIGRVIVNLVAKAATAPFALLGAALGGAGEELAYLEFEAGRARVGEAGAAKLGAIAKALANRPGLKLDIAGRADPASDREALRRVALERAVKAEKAKSLSREAAKGASLDDIEVSKDEYARFLTAAYKEARFPRPRNFIGMLKDLPVAEMEALMLANTAVGDEDLRQLANARALAAKDWLVARGGTPADRVFLVAPRLGAEGIRDKGRPARVDFALK